jgi:hypothetical protein
VKMFVIKLESGEYIKECRIGSHYLDYGRTLHRAGADEFTDFDSQVVLERLRTLGQKNAVREEAKVARSRP